MRWRSCDGEDEEESRAIVMADGRSSIRIYVVVVGDKECGDVEAYIVGKLNLPLKGVISIWVM